MTDLSGLSGGLGGVDGVGVFGGVLEQKPLCPILHSGGDVLVLGVLANTAPPEPPRLLQELDQCRWCSEGRGTELVY